MQGLNLNWVAVSFAALQDTAQSTEIPFSDEPTVSDQEVRWAIRTMKAEGYSVCLKPVVNCADGTWRAFIGFFDEDAPGEPTWGQWFESYTRFILHYARLAEEEGCEMLCIGCEMVQSDKRESEWRTLIADVRSVYHGLITYNCDKYQEDRVRWWDAVDVISSSGYYPELEWEAQLDRIERVVEREGRPFFFMEAGCPSRIGSAAKPNDWSLSGEPSESEQARWYQAMFSACSDREWVRGFILWDWPPKLYPLSEAPMNDDYCIFGKEAAAVVRQYLGEMTARWLSEVRLGEAHDEREQSG
ncbi:hypothetical protein JOD47_002053 [Arthrobacter tumbae]|nr:hypothetical protein [Arthrobacter tumbae]